MPRAASPPSCAGGLALTVGGFAALGVVLSGVFVAAAAVHAAPVLAAVKPALEPATAAS